MFNDLDWRSAARRSAVVIGIYVVLLYFLSVAFPDRFPLQINVLLFNAVMFFFVFTFVYALVDRSRRRRLSGTSNKSERARPAEDGSEAGPLKGRPNPNTSRKKARRRR